MKVRHVKLPFPLRIKGVFGIKAITLYPFVFYGRGDWSQCIEAHEAVHVRQVQDMGWLRFYVTYVLLAIRNIGKSAREHPLEKPGYAAQDACEEADATL